MQHGFQPKIFIFRVHQNRDEHAFIKGSQSEFGVSELSKRLSVCGHFKTEKKSNSPNGTEAASDGGTGPSLVPLVLTFWKLKEPDRLGGGPEEKVS